MTPLIAHRFTLTLDRAGKLRRRCLHGAICNQRGCRQMGNECCLPDDSREWYCYVHMRDQGYCPGCGNFWAGVESFDFSRSGYCENCASQGDWDDDYSDYWEDDLMDWDDLPHMQVMEIDHA